MNPRLELVEAERQSDNRLSSDFTTSQVWSDGAVAYSDSTACQSADEMSSNHSISPGSIRYDPKCQPWPQNTKLSLTKIDRVAEYGLLHPDFFRIVLNVDSFPPCTENMLNLKAKSGCKFCFPYLWGNVYVGKSD